MRTTQYIGLTNDAKSWIEKNKISEEVIVITTVFGEDVTGHKWKLKIPAGPNKEYIAIEELQDSPSSSGPMIFTRLRLILIKNIGQSIDMGTVFDWVKAPDLNNEYDQIKGQYWV